MTYSQSTSLNPLRWLHLSDMHLGAPGKDAWWSTSIQFKDEIVEKVKKFGTPDVIFITGDIVFSASQENYEKFNSFINDLDSWIDTKPPIICVPGNHDIQRPDLNKPKNFVFKVLRDYVKGDEDVKNLKNEFWEQKDASLLKPMFEPYEKFLSDIIIPRLGNHSGITINKSHFFPGDIRVDIALQGRVPLTVIGLNSTWIQCSGDDYHGKLAVEPGQLRALLESDYNDGIGAETLQRSNSILLMHHPLDWLHPNSQATFNAEIYTLDRFDICLFGHMHEAKHFSVMCGGITRRFFQAPSLFGLEHWGTNEETREIGYAWGQLENNGRIRVWPYRLAKDGNRFIFDKNWGDAEENEGLEIRPAKPDANRNKDDFSIEEEIYSSPPSVNPYKFLKFYDISDGELLYGRDKLTEDIVERVNQLFTSNENCFIGLTGRSGCGKSSLLRAGILNQLTKANQPPSYCTIAFRPTDFHDQEGNPQNIIQRIVGKIAQHTEIKLSFNSLSEIEQTSEIGRAKKSVDKIVEALSNSQSETQLRLIIGLDQFEEILDDLASSERRNNWKDLINFIDQALKSKLIGFIYTLETSRKEIVQYTDIKHLIAETNDVDGFSKEFLREIITTPFKKSGYPLNESEGEIVSRLIENTNKLRNEMKGDEVDSLLPLLAITLTRLFEIVKEKSPRQDIYNSKKTLKQTQNFIGLDVIEDKNLLDIRNAIKVEAQKAWCGEIDDLGYFLRPLLRISDITSDSFVLRKVPIHPYQGDRLQAENFINGRLLVQEGDRIRLVHEAVIRFWPAAVEWFENEKDRLKIEKNFRDESHQWSEKKRKQVSGNVDDAADILAAYSRLWTLTNSPEMNQKDRQLRDFCLAVLAKSETPQKRINSSKIGLCHIHLAAIYGQVCLLKKFKDLDPACIKDPGLVGRTPLHDAAWRTNAKAVHYLLGEGASAIKKDKEGWRPLVAPIIMGNKEIFDCLIARYRKAQLEDWPGGSTALHQFGATYLSQDHHESHLAIAHYLVEKRNLNPNQKNDFESLPIHLIANQGYTFLFKYFATISNLNAVTNNNWTALHLAASYGHVDIVNLLLENGNFSQESRNALTSIEGPAPGANALHIAILNNYPSVVKLLLENDFDPNIKAESEQYKGMNALHMAANLLKPGSFSSSGWVEREKAREIVQILLDHPTMDVNARDKENQTPLSLAKNDVSVLKMLLSDQRLDPNSPISSNGPAPMLICAEISDWELTDQVLARSSQVAHSSKTDKGNTLLHLMIQNKAPMTLIKKASDSSPVLSVTNNNGFTPLMLAIIKDDLELVRLMLTYGKGVKYPSDIVGSALLVAIEHSASPAILEELIKGDDLIQQLISTDIRGWNGQHFACAKGSESTLDWLANQDGGGLNENRDQWGRRPIDLAPLGFQKKWGVAPSNQSMPKSWDKDLEWKSLSKKRVRELIKNVSPINDKYEISSDTNAECAKLPFYDQSSVDLIRLSCEKHWPDALRLYFIIYSKENKFDFYQLNGTFPPIHELNSKNLLKLNDKNVLDYLRFFCFFVRGEEGAFLIAEDVTQHDMPDCLQPEDILKLKTHLRPAMFFGKNKGKYRASANVYYSSALFFADFSVQDSGMVEMEHDLPILEDLPINEKIPIS